MKFLTGCLLTAFLLSAYSYSYAQSYSGIHGKVTDEKHVAAEAATVILLAAADSSILKSTLCDENGLFKFNAVPGKYLLLISDIGYYTLYSGPYLIEPGKDIAIKGITIMTNSAQIKEVTVTAQRSFIEARPGKIVLNIQSSISAQSKTAAENLNDAPGVNGDKNGGYSLIGRQGALVTIDGKPINETGQAVTDYLQTIPGASIDQMELITRPSSKYEAAAGGIINIKLKKGTSAGTNFTLNSGTGFGKFYKANGGLDFNNRMGPINIFGNYNYIEDKTFHDFTNDRLINFNNVLSRYASTYNSNILRKSHTFRLGTDFAISANHTIGVLISGTIYNYNIDKNNLLSIANQGKLDSIISTTTETSRGRTNLSYDINYTGKLNKKGESIAADLVFNNIDRPNTEYIYNKFFTPAGVKYRPDLDLQNLSPANTKIWTAKVDYVNPLSKLSYLEAGIKYSKSTSNNILEFGPKIGGIYTSAAQFSNTFIYTENINSAYVNYNTEIGKLTISAGLRAEQTISEANSVTMMKSLKRNYIGLFPTLQLDYQAGGKNEISIGFSRGVSRADYDDVNPFLYYVDLYDYRKGNPSLLPQYINKIEIAYKYNNALITTLYGSETTNFYDFVNYMQDDTSKVNINTKTNFGTYSTLGIKVIAPVVINNWWTADFTLDASYQRIKAYSSPQSNYLDKGTQDIAFTSKQTFRISNSLTAELSGKYESPNYYIITQNKSMYRVTAAIGKQIFDKKGKIALTVNDIFNTYRDRGTINYQNINMSIYNKVETQTVKFSFTYRFGNISLKGIMKHKVANEEEQGRAGGVAGGGLN